MSEGIVGGYVEVGGARTYYEQTGSGPLVLLIHTAGRDSRQWHAVMGLLADRYRLVAPDLPGHGKSWPLQGEPCLDGMDELAEWLSAFVSAVGNGAYFVSGCSLGGNLTLLLAAQDERVTAAVALQAAAYTPTISETSLTMMTHPHVNLAFSNMDFTMSLVGADADADGRRFIEWGVTTVNAPAQRADLAAYTRCDIRAWLPSVTCPVVMARGEHDWVVSQDMVEATAAGLANAASVEVSILPGLGHFPHVEKPATVAGLLSRAFEAARR